MRSVTVRRKVSRPYFAISSFIRDSPRSTAEISARMSPIVLARRADVGEHQLPDLDHVLALLLDLDRGHAQPLVEDLGRLAGEAARHHAAGLDEVADGDGEAHQLAIDEDRLEHGVLGRVQAAPVGIVVDDHVALVDLGERDLLHHRAHEQRHAADLGRAELAHGDHLAFGVGERAGEVLGFGKDRGVGGLLNVDAHLAANRDYGGFDDVHRDHVHDGFLSLPRADPKLGGQFWRAISPIRILP